MNSKKYLELKLKYSGDTDQHSLALYKIQEGRILLSEDKFEDARICFNEANNISDDVSISYYFIGESYSQESDAVYSEAEELQVSADDSSSQNEYNEKMRVPIFYTQRSNVHLLSTIIYYS